MSSSKRMKASLKLYTNEASRAVMVEWYAKELGLQVELVPVDIHKEKDNKKPDFLKVNPFGQVPAIKDDDFVLSETGAIILYLAEKYGGVTSLEERATLAKWTHFANATVAPWAVPEFRKSGKMDEVLATLDGMLAEKEHLQGSFSAADVPLGSYLMYLATWHKDIDFSPYPNVIHYVKRLAKRPGCASTHTMIMEGVEALKAGGEPANKVAP